MKPYSPFTKLMVSPRVELVRCYKCVLRDRVVIHTKLMHSISEDSFSYLYSITKNLKNTNKNQKIQKIKKRGNPKFFS
jgi:hypothetical protein